MNRSRVITCIRNLAKRQEYQAVLNFEKIDIQLYRKSEFKFTITENLENTGKFDWIVPIDIPLSNHYLVKVINHNNTDVYKFSGRFGIQN
jgi:hypothetical protein